MIESALSHPEAIMQSGCGDAHIGSGRKTFPQLGAGSRVGLEEFSVITGEKKRHISIPADVYTSSQFHIVLTCWSFQSK